MKRVFMFLVTIVVISTSALPSFVHAKPPHGIILISLDTLRADHLSCYGYHRITSPFIDGFAKEGIVFEQAVVQSQWTLPSHMSIMTSLYPTSHGVTKTKDRLADAQVTLAELLRKGGFKTAAFVDGGFMNSSFGFNHGFEIYDEDQWGSSKGILTKVKGSGRGVLNGFFPKLKDGLIIIRRPPFSFLSIAMTCMPPMIHHPPMTVCSTILPIRVIFSQPGKPCRQYSGGG